MITSMDTITNDEHHNVALYSLWPVAGGAAHAPRRLVRIRQLRMAGVVLQQVRSIVPVRFLCNESPDGHAFVYVYACAAYRAVRLSTFINTENRTSRSFERNIGFLGTGVDWPPHS